MKQIFFSAKLFAYGAFCDICATFCTNMTEKYIFKNKSLNKKLLIFMSNFSNNNLVRWQNLERRFIHRFFGG